MTDGLIIFDCDGVLVDSEALVVDVESEILTAAGFPLSPQDLIEQYVGLNYEAMMTSIGEAFGRPVPPDVAAAVPQAALDRLVAEVRPVPGITEVLDGLGSRPRCVASSSSVERIEASLRTAGIDHHVKPEWIFSADHVENPKPAPDVFVLAARSMGVDPARCLVIEDSGHGVTAAVAAGMTAVGFVAAGHMRPDSGERLVAAGAVEVFARGDALAEYVMGFQPG
ncbi:MAG: HAD family phosphatase [Actinomycetota bacterium]